MTRGQDAKRRSQQREIMLQTLNPDGMDSIPSANFDLLADSASCSQWPTLPLSPRGHARGGSCSFLDGSPTRDGMRHLTDTLDTLPRGTSYRLVGPVESEFDLLEASEVLPSTETPLLEPALEHAAIEHAADACPSGVRPAFLCHHRKAPPRTHSITLPQPPEGAGHPAIDESLQFPPSPASSLLLSSGGATDAYTATQYTNSINSRSKQCEPCSSPVPAATLPDPPMSALPSGTPPRPAAVSISHLHASERPKRAFGPPAEAVAAPAAQPRMGRGSADINRSPVSDATVVSGSSESSPPWMSSGAPASEHPLGILAPQCNSTLAHSIPNPSSFKMDDGETSNFQSCMSSMISTSMMSMDENTGKLPSIPQQARHAWKKPSPLEKEISSLPSSVQEDAEPGTAPVFLGASANQAWCNPIYRSNSVHTDIMDTLGSQPAASGVFPNYHLGYLNFPVLFVLFSVYSSCFDPRRGIFFSQPLRRRLLRNLLPYA